MNYITPQEQERIQEIENIMNPLRKEKTRILARVRQRKWEKETRNKESQVK